MRNSSRAQLAQPATPVRNIKSVVLGDIAFKTWYPSFYPEALVGKNVDALFVCKWCFVYTKDVQAYLGHCRVCPHSASPPGRLIYTKDGTSIYEIDGEEDKLFAQNLSLFAKLFLDNKSVFFDVVGFRYYLLYTSLPALGSTRDASSRPSGLAQSNLPTPSTDDSKPDHRQLQKDGQPTQPQIVGFFSKEKLSWDLNNLACILVFPPWQRRGLGRVLMGCSYTLGAREGRIGGPEKPLSELGRRGYLSFWQSRVAVELLRKGGGRGASKKVTLSSASSTASNGAAVATTTSSSSGTTSDVGGGGSGGATGAASSGASRGRRLDVATLADQCAMVPDDVITALREMAICERRIDGKDDVVVVSKAKVREWAAKMRVSLRPPVDEDAFIWEGEEDGIEAEEEDEGDDGDDNEEEEEDADGE